MSVETVHRVHIRCDGCQEELEGEFASATEARGAAYAGGWRMPPKIGKQGNPTARTSDVCPRCLPTWKPQLATIWRDRDGDRP